VVVWHSGNSIVHTARVTSTKLIYIELG